MTPDRRILSKTRAIFEEKRRLSGSLQLQRQAALYAACPEIEGIDGALRALGVEIARSVFEADSARRLAEIKARAAELRANRTRLLQKAGLTEPESESCADCGDTGYLPDGGFCECFRKEYIRQTLSYLSGKLPVGTFESFKPQMFSSAEDPEYGVSPRAAAETNARVLRTFAEKFDATHENLYMMGPSSCGKTYLAAAAARRAAERGFSVEYQTAFNLCADFEAQRFGRGDEDTDAAVRAYFDCDLLVLDDLGCEMSSAFSGPAIYNLLSSRHTAGKSTVILSELSSADISSRYMPQTAGRIRNDYTNLIFLGGMRRCD